MAEPARQKLNFDDNDDEELDKHQKHERSPPQFNHDTSGLLRINDSRETSFRSPMPLYRMNPRSRTPSPAVVTFNGGRDFMRRELYSDGIQSRRRRSSRGRRTNLDGFTHRASPLLN